MSVLRVLVACLCFEAAAQDREMSITGTLQRMAGIGGESTGWGVELDAEREVGGQKVRHVEISHSDAEALNRLVDKRVEASGTLVRRRGVERQRWVLEAASIREVESKADLGQLFSRVWRVKEAPSQPAPGSIYVFLLNGTLLQTSCGETYRIARWTADKSTPGRLQVVEDGRPAYTAEILEASDRTLRLKQKLAKGNETWALTLEGIEEEVVCPDLRK
jgi:hypothetical protein